MEMTIPQVRARLHVLAEEYGFPELAELAEATKRRQSEWPRAKAEHPQLSTEQEQEVRDYADLYPNKAYLEIATDLDIALRSVSYAIAGKKLGTPQ